MRGMRVVLGLIGAIALGPLLAVAQQLPISQQRPIFGCRMAISCRSSPIGLSALNDPASGNILFGARFSWGPGFHFELVTPLKGSSSSEPTGVVDAHLFHLGGVSLWPPPPPTPVPPATPVALPDR